MTVLKNFKCSLKSLNGANGEVREKAVNINLVMTEIISSLGRQAIVVHVQLKRGGRLHKQQSKLLDMDVKQDGNNVAQNEILDSVGHLDEYNGKK